jgi:hypothetical protein
MEPTRLQRKARLPAGAVLWWRRPFPGVGTRTFSRRDTGIATLGLPQHCTIVTEILRLQIIGSSSRIVLSCVLLSGIPTAPPLL